MGAESSTFISSEWSEAEKNGLWWIQHGKTDSGDEVSMFTPVKNDKKSENLLRKLTKQLRLVRHPCILIYLESQEDVDTPQLFTEKAVPLDSVLSTLDPIEICAGLHSVMQALSFLHEKAGVSHNNLHTGCIYVSTDGSWKLGGLEHATRFSETTATTLASSRKHREDTAIAPEEKAGKVLPGSELGHARDVYAFAVMVEGMLERLSELGELIKTFELRIQDECLDEEPRKRPKMASLLNDRLFTTEFLQIAAFLDNVALKSATERKKFFRHLLPKLFDLPEEFSAKRLAPKLLSRFVLLDVTAVEYILPSVLTPCSEDERPSKFKPGEIAPLFTESVFKRYLVPKLVKIFTVHDFHVHILMLTYLRKFIYLVDKDDLEFEILPQALLGLRDSSNEIAALSLHALADMIPILGREAVIGGKCKTFFKEGLPKDEGRTKFSPNNRHSNVSGVMPNMKLVEMTSPSGRPYTNSTKPPNDTDQVLLNDPDGDRELKELEKRKERDRKREEMKRQREERKRARDAARAKVVEEEKCKGLGTRIVEPNENIIDTERISPRQSKNSVQDNDADWSDQNEAEKPSFSKSDWTAPNDSSAVNENGESHWSENEDENWSDFGDNSKNDSDISDEIEKELEMMTVSDPVISSIGENSLQRQPKIKGSALKLAVNKTKTEKESEISALDKTTKTFDSEKKMKTKAIPTKSSPKSQSSKSRTQAKTLGAEFDIKTIDIKVEKKEADPFDFFADMKPNIETKSSLLESSHKGKTESDSVSPEHLHFEVMEATEVEEGGGWGDEDW
ncbi:protein-associating with the carboxyl-terminal domain of ezrin-like isoform X2 [Mya arenaria]|uniref:protein-associating with the carboxyl-terminal domain of ezrin-like isoform X2 n=1 Tax=Mya arenaria TaxID=6604 RepID=UPI0022E04E26|nr:protein-associating with the carboxyl-terminal domain of ezrin-like isoform X2 [Mya arenaria]